MCDGNTLRCEPVQMYEKHDDIPSPSVKFKTRRRKKTNKFKKKQTFCSQHLQLGWIQTPCGLRETFRKHWSMACFRK